MQLLGQGQPTHVSRGRIHQTSTCTACSSRDARVTHAETRKLHIPEPTQVPAPPLSSWQGPRHWMAAPPPRPPPLLLSRAARCAPAQRPATHRSPLAARCGCPSRLGRRRGGQAARGRDRGRPAVRRSRHDHLGAAGSGHPGAPAPAPDRKAGGRGRPACRAHDPPSRRGNLPAAPPCPPCSALGPGSCLWSGYGFCLAFCRGSYRAAATESVSEPFGRCPCAPR